MLATSKMTGLDLVGSGGGSIGLGGHGGSLKDSSEDSKRSSTSSDEMLSTPKFPIPDSAGHGGGGLRGQDFSKAATTAFMSRQAALASLASSGSISPRYSEASSTNNNIQMSNDGDMLTTPVVTTPKTSDHIWLTHTPPHHKLNFEACGTSPGPG